MRRAVIDADTLLEWFGPDPSAMRRQYEAGELTVVAPRTILPDVLTRLARRPGWTAERLVRAAIELDRLGLELHDVAAVDVAPYVARGLPADLAAYPGLAAALDLRLHARDPQLIRVAGPHLATD